MAAQIVHMTTNRWQYDFFSWKTQQTNAHGQNRPTRCFSLNELKKIEFLLFPAHMPWNQCRLNNLVQWTNSHYRTVAIMFHVYECGEFISFGSVLLPEIHRLHSINKIHRCVWMFKMWSIHGKWMQLSLLGWPALYTNGVKIQCFKDVTKFIIRG
jgi:hypothetical protein